MPTRNISLTADQSAFIDRLVATGEYQNASETIRDALRALKQRRREDELRLASLRMQLKEGIADLDAGRFVALDESELEAFVGLRKRRRRSRAR
jgi:antitoxin ParD1/3/4